MNVIVIKERSQGNDTVGDSWLDTKIFTTDNTLGAVLTWVSKLTHNEGNLRSSTRYGKCILSVPEE